MSTKWTTEDVRRGFMIQARNDHGWVHGDEASQAAAGKAGRAFDEWLAGVKAQAWDEGHRHRWRRGPDDCRCNAWSSIECACGLYGTGELLSLGDNPYRTGTDHG